jgi:Sulfatase-modifying factor enzyme 1
MRSPVKLRSMPLAAALLAGIATMPTGAVAKCAPDAVAVGTVCVDRYEGSVWRIPPSQKTLVAKVVKGRAQLADLTAGGAEQMAPLAAAPCTGSEYGPGFPPTGNWTERLYAVSIPGVRPSTCITWFQAEQACRLSGKRLATNQEWQAAAAGTPDPGAADDGSSTCATATPSGVATGSRSACVSSWGAHDLIGNAAEWTADWGALAGSCASWTLDGFGEDGSCSGNPEGASVPHLPSAFVRGGDSRSAPASGAFAFDAASEPFVQRDTLGFRCAR